MIEVMNHNSIEVGIMQMVGSQVLASVGGGWTDPGMFTFKNNWQNEQRNISIDIKTGLKDLEEAIDVINYCRSDRLKVE